MTARTIGQPVVYAGPTIEPEAVRRILPSARVQPPIRRGQLYRDRTFRAGLFVILDGEFLQQLAVSTREVVDVARDGALVVGASSMGALRAAECWPAGVRGFGSVYRMFRAGWLQSDDEVAVAHAPDRPVLHRSVALVDVRHAVSWECRRGGLDPTLGRALVDAAVDSWFADRTWPGLLRAVGAYDPDRARQLARHSLKRRDAERALRGVARWLETDPELGHRPREAVPFRRSELDRERDPEPVAVDPETGGQGAPSLRERARVWARSEAERRGIRASEADRHLARALLPIEGCPDPSAADLSDRARVLALRRQLFGSGP